MPLTQDFYNGDESGEKKSRKCKWIFSLCLFHFLSARKTIGDFLPGNAGLPEIGAEADISFFQFLATPHGARWSGAMAHLLSEMSPYDALWILF